MKTKAKVSIITFGLAIAAIMIVFGQKEDRLVGTFVPDLQATQSRWELGKSLSEANMSNVLSQIFREKPMIMTDRHMIIASDSGQVTSRYVVIWKGSQFSIIGMSHLEIFRIDYTEDGAWFTKTGLLPQRPYPMILKMNRMPQPAPPPYSSPAAGSESGEA